MNNFYDILGKSLAKDHIYWGYHLLVDARGCDKSTINSSSTIKTFIETMVDKLHMIPVGEPILREFNDDNGRGVSCIQLVTTSHFSVHTDDTSMAAYIDIFSCEKYDPEVALKVIHEFFNPKEIIKKFVLRDPDMLENEKA